MNERWERIRLLELAQDSLDEVLGRVLVLDADEEGDRAFVSETKATILCLRDELSRRVANDLYFLYASGQLEVAECQ